LHRHWPIGTVRRGQPHPCAPGDPPMLQYTARRTRHLVCRRGCNPAPREHDHVGEFLGRKRIGCIHHEANPSFFSCSQLSAAG
jgi:hypothetical protein